MNRTPHEKGRTVEFGAWREERRRSLGRQVELLGDRSAPRTHRARSEEEWKAITDGARAELRRRTASGCWTWVDARRMVVGRP